MIAGPMMDPHPVGQASWGLQLQVCGGGDVSQRPYGRWRAPKPPGKLGASAAGLWWGPTYSAALVGLNSMESARISAMSLAFILSS